MPRGREGGYRRGRAARRRIAWRRPGASSAGCKEHASGLGARSFLPRMNRLSGWEREGEEALLDLGRERRREEREFAGGGGGGEAVHRREVADTGRNGDGGRGGRTRAAMAGVGGDGVMYLG